MQRVEYRVHNFQRHRRDDDLEGVLNGYARDGFRMIEVFDGHMLIFEREYEAMAWEPFTCRHGCGYECKAVNGKWQVEQHEKKCLKRPISDGDTVEVNG